MASSTHGVLFLQPVLLMLLLLWQMPTSIESVTPTNSLRNRTSGKNGFFVCLPGQGFCCAAAQSGFLFPSVDSGFCISMGRCLANGTIVIPSQPVYYQDPNCTVPINTSTQIPDCTGYIQTTQVNIIQSYIATNAARMLHPTMISAAAVVISLIGMRLAM